MLFLVEGHCIEPGVCFETVCFCDRGAPLYTLVECCPALKWMGWPRQAADHDANLLNLIVPMLHKEPRDLIALCGIAQAPGDPVGQPGWPAAVGVPGRH
jgi:hypothetical protein